MWRWWHVDFTGVEASNVSANRRALQRHDVVFRRKGKETEKWVASWQNHAKNPSIILMMFFFRSIFSFAVMRLGKKKEKDRDGEKEQCIDGVARLICSAKQSHPVPLRGELFVPNMCGRGQCWLCPFLSYSSSLHRRHRVDGRQVLPTFVPVANAREKFPCGSNRRSIVGNLVNNCFIGWSQTPASLEKMLKFSLHFNKFLIQFSMRKRRTQGGLAVHSLLTQHVYIFCV